MSMLSDTSRLYAMRCLAYSSLRVPSVYLRRLEGEADGSRGKFATAPRVDS